MPLEARRGIGHRESELKLKLDATHVPHPQVDEDSGMRFEGPWPVPMDGIEAWEAGGKVVLAWDLGPSAVGGHWQNSDRHRAPGRGTQVLQPPLRMPPTSWTIGLWVKWTEEDSIIPNAAQATLLRFSAGLTFGLDAGGIGFAGPEVEAARRARGTRMARLQVPRNVWTAIFLIYDQDAEDTCEVVSSWDKRGLRHLGTLGHAPRCKDLLGVGGEHHVGYLAQISIWTRLLSNEEQAAWFGLSASRFGLGSESPSGEAHELSQLLHKIADGADRLRRDSSGSLGSSPRSGPRRRRLGGAFGGGGGRRRSLESMASAALTERSQNSRIVNQSMSKIYRLQRLLNEQVVQPRVPSRGASSVSPKKIPSRTMSSARKGGRSLTEGSSKSCSSPTKSRPASVTERGRRPAHDTQEVKGGEEQGAEGYSQGQDRFRVPSVVLTRDEHAALIQQASRLLAEAEETDMAPAWPGEVTPTRPAAQQAWNAESDSTNGKPLLPKPKASALAARRNVAQPEPVARLLPPCDAGVPPRPGAGAAVEVNAVQQAERALREGNTPDATWSSLPDRRVPSKSLQGPLNRAALLSSLAHCYAAAAYQWFEENDEEDLTVEDAHEGIGYGTLPALASSLRTWPFNAERASAAARPAKQTLARAAAEDELVANSSPLGFQLVKPRQVARSVTAGNQNGKSISRRVREAEQQLRRNDFEMRKLRCCLDNLSTTLQPKAHLRGVA